MRPLEFAKDQMNYDSHRLEIGTNFYSYDGLEFLTRIRNQFYSYDGLEFGTNFYSYDGLEFLTRIRNQFFTAMMN